MIHLTHLTAAHLFNLNLEVWKQQSQADHFGWTLLCPGNISTLGTPPCVNESSFKMNPPLKFAPVLKSVYDESLIRGRFPPTRSQAAIIKHKAEEGYESVSWSWCLERRPTCMFKTLLKHNRFKFCRSLITIPSFELGVLEQGGV